ncbi:uncharacterized protein LOC131248317 [Magnolia sinica]|uniref:uncharacterized protein LOC131248317 n=1 Tax=Magnolia sinica TaxID=86752 RepID=UPI00265B0E47|nr:uncharacterized protein LOC131248317 [Magnolia sinica]XP_058104544.1 uncharacterized protein LOC131248317 [Magnolia sinica]
MAKSYFKQEHDLEKRRAEAARIREKYPDRIPAFSRRSTSLGKHQLTLTQERRSAHLVVTNGQWMNRCSTVFSAFKQQMQALVRVIPFFLRLSTVRIFLPANQKPAASVGQDTSI